MQATEQSQVTEESNNHQRLSVYMILTVMIVNIFFGICNLRFWPEFTLHKEMFQSDSTLNLCVLNTLTNGGRLYSDLFYQYGPLFPTLFKHFSTLFANKVAALFWFDSLLNTLAQLLVLGMACRYVRSRWLLSLIVVCCYLRFRGFFGTYNLIERVMLFTCVIFWSSYANRTTSRNLLLGAWVGALQWLKFGVGPVLALASILLDLLEYRHRRRSDFRLLVRSYIVVFGAAGVFEFAFIVWAFFTYQSDIAWEMVFPVYFLESYASFGGFGNPFRFMDLGYFACKQLPIIAALLLTVVLITKLFRRRQSVEAHSYLLLPVFYVLCCFSLFRQHYLLWGYDYAVLFAFFSVLQVRSFPIVRVLLGLLFFLPLAVSAKNLLIPKPPVCTEKVTFPNGEYLYFPPAEAEVHRKIMSIITARKAASEKQVRGIFCYMGFYYFYEIAPVGRHVYFLTGFPKPFDAGLLSERNSTVSWCIWPSATFLDDVERWFKNANPFPKSIFQPQFDRARRTWVENTLCVYEF